MGEGDANYTTRTSFSVKVLTTLQLNLNISQRSSIIQRRYLDVVKTLVLFLGVISRRDDVAFRLLYNIDDSTK